MTRLRKTSFVRCLMTNILLVFLQAISATAFLGSCASIGALPRTSSCLFKQPSEEDGATKQTDNYETKKSLAKDLKEASFDSTEVLSWAFPETPEENILVSIAPSTVGNGNGLFVKESIPKNHAIMTISSDKLLSITDAWEDSELGELLMNFTDTGGADSKLSALAGFVTKEFCGGISELFMIEGESRISKWQPYFNCFPWTELTDHVSKAGQDHVLWWSDEQVDQLLLGTNIYQDAVKMRKQVESSFEEVRTIWVDPHAKYQISWDWWDDWRQWGTPHEYKLYEHLIYERFKSLFRSAFCMLFSRAFEDEEHDCMKFIPVLDMTQHCSIEHENIRYETDPSSGSILVTAKRDLQKGEELFRCYSTTLEQAQFLTLFGFVPNEKALSARELLENRDPIFFGKEELTQN